MANFVVFVDLENAKVFQLSDKGYTEKKLHRHEMHHHTGVEKEKNNHKHADKFYHEVAKELATASEILIVGPGNAKNQFKAHLDEHHHEQVAKKVVGVETIDHPTDGQIAALAKKFFKTHLRMEAIR